MTCVERIVIKLLLHDDVSGSENFDNTCNHISRLVMTIILARLSCFHNFQGSHMILLDFPMLVTKVFITFPSVTTIISK